MNEHFAQRMSDSKVARDTRTVADFVQIHCDGHHGSEPRAAVETDAALLGVYGRKRPVLCAECIAHLAYAEKRRAYCPKDPKPFCAHCDTHCYVSAEREWQRQMMRYAGPRSWNKGHAIDGIKHMVEARTYRKHMQRTARAAAGTSEEKWMTATITRQIVHIDEDACTGCGLCVSPCAEGAIVIENGKAKVVREELCDGAGFCLGVCPTGALTIETREAAAFDHDAVEEHAAATPKTYIAQECFRCGTSEDEAPLLPVRTQGTSTWVCTRCLPTLIHG